ncbi:MAG TPA: citrate synthase [Phenylobacterium sp.]|jgi:citrate synthase|uniref:citrate synthase n=1 Tax=Phenylobacterium sp. TaxID=1871053 RepID=UPI002D6F7734|nr:citrate synthase [Phenylobacterium sp.]HZZ69512.1 citrate synthase [Phenylobacterium sp.]
MSAAEAAEALGVSRQTLYVYVGRKGIRSQAIEGTRQRKYWRADVERVGRGDRDAEPPAAGDFRQETAVTLITETDLFYRGRSAVELAENASFESVAALLWSVPEADVFGQRPPAQPPTYAAVYELMKAEEDVNRATALFPGLEEANPRAYDLSVTGMARTGADVLRWLAAITVSADAAPTGPIHEFLAERLGRGAVDADLIRRVLVLSADHGFEPGTVAVRGVASTGVSPWRSVMTGLSISFGRRGRLGSHDAVRRLLREIAESPDPAAPIIQRIKDGEDLPGFESEVYAHGDPRARALVAAAQRLLPDDPAFHRLQAALRAAREIRGLEPNFALLCLFVQGRIGLGPRSALFSLGRSAGWIAHSIEQYQAGEMRHRLEIYTGPLPG